MKTPNYLKMYEENLPLWKLGIFLGLFVAVCVLVETQLKKTTQLPKEYYYRYDIKPDLIRIIENERLLAKFKNKPQGPCGLRDRDFKEYVQWRIKGWKLDKTKSPNPRYMPNITMTQKHCIGYAVVYLEKK